MSDVDIIANQTSGGRMKKCIAVQAAPAAVAPYSQGVHVGNVVYLSGQLGIDPAQAGLPRAALPPRLGKV